MPTCVRFPVFLTQFDGKKDADRPISSGKSISERCAPVQCLLALDSERKRQSLERSTRWPGDNTAKTAAIDDSWRSAAARRARHRDELRWHRLRARRRRRNCTRRSAQLSDCVARRVRVFIICQPPNRKSALNCELKNANQVSEPMYNVRTETGSTAGRIAYIICRSAVPDGNLCKLSVRHYCRTTSYIGYPSGSSTGRIAYITCRPAAWRIATGKKI